jgi:hypothetical protein
VKRSTKEVATMTANHFARIFGRGLAWSHHDALRAVGGPRRDALEVYGR